MKSIFAQQISPFYSSKIYGFKRSAMADSRQTKLLNLVTSLKLRVAKFYLIFVSDVIFMQLKKGLT